MILAKKLQEVILSSKTKNSIILLSLLTAIMYRRLIHKSVVLDNRLSFEDHFKMILNKVNKAIGIFLKLQNIPLRSALLTIFKTFIRPHLDYGHIVYGQAYNTSLHLKLELLRYNTCLTITGAIRSTSREKLYEELGLKSLQLHSWYRKLTCLYKLFIS